MARAEFENGLPSIHEVNWDDKEELTRLQTAYGQFAATVLDSVLQADPDAPSNILACGKNWLQLTSFRARPQNDEELALLAAVQKVDLDMANIPPFMVDSWQLMKRYPGHTIRHVLDDLYEGVQAGSVDANIMERMAVLDLSELTPILNEADFPEGEETPWGINGVLPGTNTLIYHITSGYPRQLVQEMPNISDNISATLHQFGDIKWE